MRQTYNHAGVQIYHGKCEDVLPTMPDASVDALVTDPPSGIGFMGIEWDKHKGGRDQWIAWLCGIMTDCRRILKPGGYGWVWALPRTSHWTATACEDAGFEIRDIVTHVFGQGMPKSKALLKPAAEHWILIRAPGELRELRIEENRIGTSKHVPASAPQVANAIYGARPVSALNENTSGYDPNTGRWPANFALSHSEDCAETCAEGCLVAELDRQSLSAGIHSAGQARDPGIGKAAESYNASSYHMGQSRNMRRLGDEGGASKFFYVAKPSKSEKSRLVTEGNNHPTVKPVRLMRHLIELITEPGDMILDPFLGSGTTALAAKELHRKLIGVEQNADYCALAEKRLAQDLLPMGENR
jgi:site-specific DNA-methyltransferase (adenine-specific)